MKLSRLSAAFLGGSLFLSASVFAAPANRKSLRLYETITVAGKQLPPGEYKLEWTGTGDNVQVSIIKGKEVVATLPAKVVNATSANPKDGYETSSLQDGSKTLKQIFFSGKNYDLEIQQAGSATASNPSGSN